EERDDALDRLRVAVVGGLGAQVGDAAADASSLFLFHTEGTRRPWVDLHEVEVLDAAAAQRGLPFGVLLHAHDGRQRLAEEQRRPHPRPDTPRTHLSLAN